MDLGVPLFSEAPISCHRDHLVQANLEITGWCWGLFANSTDQQIAGSSMQCHAMFEDTFAKSFFWIDNLPTRSAVSPFLVQPRKRKKTTSLGIPTDPGVGHRLLWPWPVLDEATRFVLKGDEGGGCYPWNRLTDLLAIFCSWRMMGFGNLYWFLFNDILNLLKP